MLANHVQCQDLESGERQESKHAAGICFPLLSISRSGLIGVRN